MDHFKKFNDRLWTAKGDKFMASLELKSDRIASRYEIEMWNLMVRGRNGI